MASWYLPHHFNRIIPFLSKVFFKKKTEQNSRWWIELDYSISNCCMKTFLYFSIILQTIGDQQFQADRLAGFYRKIIISFISYIKMQMRCCRKNNDLQLSYVRPQQFSNTFCKLVLSSWLLISEREAGQILLILEREIARQKYILYISVSL